MKSESLVISDQHQGRNTAHARGIPDEEIVLGNPRKGLTPEELERARVIEPRMWKQEVPTDEDIDPEEAAHRGDRDENGEELSAELSAAASFPAAAAADCSELLS